MIQSLQGFRRQIPGDSCIETGGAGVHVGVGALASSADVLLLGGVAHFENHVQALGFIPDAVPGGTEVQKLYISVLCNVDVIRGHIPVNEAFGVDGGESPQHGNHHIQSLLHAHLPASVGDVGFKGDSLDVVHDEIGSSVLVKVVRHPGDIWLPHEFGQNPGFFLKAFLSVSEIISFCGGHHRERSSVHAGGQLSGHVLFHRHTGG